TGTTWRPANILNGLPQPLSGAPATTALQSWNAARGCTNLSADPGASLTTMHGETVPFVAPATPATTTTVPAGAATTTTTTHAGTSGTSGTASTTAPSTTSTTGGGHGTTTSTAPASTTTQATDNAG